MSSSKDQPVPSEAGPTDDQLRRPAGAGAINQAGPQKGGDGRGCDADHAACSPSVHENTTSGVALPAGVHLTIDGSCRGYYVAGA